MSHDAMNMTLDEFIRRKKAADSVCLLDMRKKEKDVICKEELDEDLEDIVQEKVRQSQSTMSCLSKFDRIRISADTDNDDDDTMDNPSIKFAKEIEKMEHPDCCKSKPFRTIEEKLKVKIKSQQYRLNGQGNRQQQQQQGVLNGRIGRNYRQNRTGQFVDKGDFTFKYEDDNESGIVGIVRNKNRFNGSNVRVNNRNMNNGGTNSAPITVNMNWRGFFQGISQFSKIIAPPPSPVHPSPQAANGMANVNLQFAARDLLEFLESKKTHKEEAERKAKSPLSFAQQYARDAGMNEIDDDEDLMAIEDELLSMERQI